MLDYNSEYVDTFQTVASNKCSWSCTHAGRKRILHNIHNWCPVAGMSDVWLSFQSMMISLEIDGRRLGKGNTV